MAPTVLIIESDEHSLEAMSRAFVSHGAEVSTARDGEAGYASAESTSPDLIVLSVELRGGASGYTVCKKLKRSDAVKDIPVFIVSATATPPDCVPRSRRRAERPRPACVSWRNERPAPPSSTPSRRPPNGAASSGRNHIAK